MFQEAEGGKPEMKNQVGGVMRRFYLHFTTEEEPH